MQSSNYHPGLRRLLRNLLCMSVQNSWMNCPTEYATSPPWVCSIAVLIKKIHFKKILRTLFYLHFKIPKVSEKVNFICILLTIKISIFLFKAGIWHTFLRNLHIIYISYFLIFSWYFHSNYFYDSHTSKASGNIYGICEIYYAQNLKR